MILVYNICRYQFVAVGVLFEYASSKGRPLFEWQMLLLLLIILHP